MFITKKNGTIPSEAEGMNLLIKFLEGLDEDDELIEEITCDTEGVITLVSQKGKTVFYNPITAEFGLVDKKRSIPRDITTTECSTEDVCVQGCGCECWVDKGWRDRKPLKIPGIHCKVMDLDIEEIFLT